MYNRRNAFYLLLIISLLSGLFTGRTFFFNVAYLLFGLLLVAYLWSWLAVRWISVGRRTRARSAQVGRSLEESFEVHNDGPIPKLWLEVRDHSELPGHYASHVVPLLGARRSYRWETVTPCVVRGEFRLGPMTLMSGDPFGLFVSPRRLGASSRVVVYPLTVPVRYFELPIGIISGGEPRRQRTGEMTTNVAGVRDYERGDSFARIDWRNTARHRHLMVKEFEIDPLVDVWLLVDFSESSLVEDPSVQRLGGRYGTVIPNGQFIPASTEEYSVVIAASLAAYFIEMRRTLGFTAYIPERVVHEPERGNLHLTHMMQTLAVARSRTPYTLSQMLRQEMPSFSRGTTLIIITASLDPAWIGQAQILGRKGIRPLCILVDPASFGGLVPSDEARYMLEAARIPALVVRRNDDIAEALAQRAV